MQQLFFYFLTFKSLTITGLSTILNKSSNKKFAPTSPKIIYRPTSPLRPAASAHMATVSIKKMRQPIKNTPVFTIGHTHAAATTATNVLYFSRSLYVSPASNPQAVPFARTVIIVPGTLTAKNAAASPMPQHFFIFFLIIIIMLEYRRTFFL